MPETRTEWWLLGHEGWPDGIDFPTAAEAEAAYWRYDARRFPNARIRRRDVIRYEPYVPDRTIRSGDPLDCPACGYDPMAPHNGKGDCAIDRTSGCRDCGCPDRSDDHLREEWTCGCQCHTDRMNGTSDD